jgi:hypothetical protein
MTALRGTHVIDYVLQVSIGEKNLSLTMLIRGLVTTVAQVITLHYQTCANQLRFIELRIYK